jgi:hypothetical protein
MAGVRRALSWGGGGRGWKPMASFGLLSKCAGARVMGVAMVISAWGEGVNVCCAPPPPRRIARRPPKARVKTMLRTGYSRKIFLCGRNARDGCFDGDCSLGGGGWSVCVPLPLVGSHVVRQNTRKNRWPGPRTRPHLPSSLPPPPPCLISKKGTETLRQTYSFFYTRMQQCSPIGYIIG